MKGVKVVGEECRRRARASMKSEDGERRKEEKGESL